MTSSCQKGQKKKNPECHFAHYVDTKKKHLETYTVFIAALVIYAKNLGSLLQEKTKKAKGKPPAKIILMC